MDTASFLARVIPPGNYLAIAYNTQGPGQPARFAQQFFQGGDYTGAAGLLKWAAKKGLDAYHACASFVMAEANGTDKRNQPKFRGSRTQENAQRLKAFWIDLDVKRTGDGKKADTVYPDKLAAMKWLQGFWTAVGLPRPNMVVSSGYGIHAYWLVETPLTAVEWVPYGSALKAALIANGYKGDSGVCADSARILRPAGTVNMKSGQPAPVEVMDKWVAADYPNALVLDPLKVFLGQTTPNAPRASAQVTQLSGGPSPIFSGNAAPNLNAAATANMPRPNTRPHEFARIATRCAQVEKSLNNGGDGDPYRLWYIGHLSLAHHCVDGAQFVHPISAGDKRYNAANVDAAVARIAVEKANNDIGPPTCNTYVADGHNGVCQACPHFGKIRSPWVLGADDSDLPGGYRRYQGNMQRWVDGKDGNGYWTRMCDGIVSMPVLDHTPNGYAIIFTYEHGGKTWSIQAHDAAMSTESGALRSFFAGQHITLSRILAQSFGDFIVAWIQQLREQRAEREARVSPFGWATDGSNKHVGLAIGGVLYRADGTQEAVPGGEREVIDAFVPKGDLAKWRHTADFVMNGRPDLQILVAGAFAAPLVKLASHKGLALSAWSKDSGVGKSAALKVSQAVWSGPAQMNSMTDTTNFVRAKIAATRSVVCNWDEVRLGKDNIDSAVNMFYELTQGKDKGRLNADSTMKHVGEWETMLVLCGNAPLMDHIVAQAGATDSGAVRVLEMHLDRTPLPRDATATKLIGQVETNYGSAGIVYAKWLSENRDEAEKLVLQFTDVMGKKLNTLQEERFHLATIATLLAGAKLANAIGLAKFDLRGMMDLLVATVERLRSDRKRNIITSGGVTDYEQILGMFVSEFAGNRLVTDRFARRGQGALVKTLWPPLQARCDIQVAQQDKIMRINEDTFRKWCYKHGFAYPTIMDGFTKRWTVARTRRIIGAGTNYGGGQIAVIDIPLIVPELESYLMDTAAPATAPGGGILAPALAGNKPKI